MTWKSSFLSKVIYYLLLSVLSVKTLQLHEFFKVNPILCMCCQVAFVCESIGFVFAHHKFC